jgi:foldase protein PrsA
MLNRSTTSHSARPAHKWIWISILCVLLLFLSACGNNNNEPAAEKEQTSGETAEEGKGAPQEGGEPAADPDAVVADYEGGKITRGEFDAFLGVNLFFNSSDPRYLQYMNANPNYEKEMLNQFIGLKLLAEEAEETQKKQALELREAQMKSMENASEEQKQQFETVLNELNITIDDIGNYYETRQLAFGVLNKRVNDEAVQEEYDRLKAMDEHAFITATVSHILITVDNPSTGEAVRTKEEALERAKEVKQKLDSGEDFAALVAEYSEDEGSKQTGGTYEDANITGWVPGFKEAAATLPLNEISDPVETQFGYHILKVTERNTQELEEVKEMLRSQVTGNLFVEFVETDVPELTKEVNLPEAPAQG